jgi:hypothetical protein
MSFEDDIADVMNFPEHWEDILDTAEELEKVLGEGLAYLSDTDRMKEMEKSITTMLVGLNVSAENLTKLFDPLAEQFDSMTETIKNAVGIDLSASINLPDTPDMSWIIDEIKKNLPSLPDLPDPDIMSKLTGILDLFAMPDVDVSVKLKNLQNIASGGTTGAFGGTARPAPDAVMDWNKSIEDIFSTFLDDHKATIEAIFNKLEAVVKDTFISDISDIQTEFQSVIDLIVADTETKPSIKEIMSEILVVVKRIAGIAKSKVEKLIAIIFNSLSGLISIATDAMGKSIADSEISEFYKAMIPDDRELKLTTLLCLPLAVPLTLMHKAVTGGENISFPSFPQNFYESKIGYGICQILSGSAMCAGICIKGYNRSHVSQVLDKGFFEKEGWLVKYDILGLVGIVLNVFLQLMSMPDPDNPGDNAAQGVRKGDLKAAIWDYQWFMCVVWPVLMWGSALLKLNKIRPFADESSPLYKKFDRINPVGNMIFEIIHFGLFCKLFSDEEDKEDKRIRDCYMIDPLPGIFNSAFELYALYRKPA